MFKFFPYTQRTGLSQPQVKSVTMQGKLMQVFLILSIVSKIIKGEKENKRKTKVIDL